MPLCDLVQLDLTANGQKATFAITERQVGFDVALYQAQRKKPEVANASANRASSEIPWLIFQYVLA